MTGSNQQRDRRDPRALFDELWTDDPWQLDSTRLDQARYDRQVTLLEDRRYDRALELGCAGGSFTRRLVPLCRRIVAVDIAEAALDQARAAGLGDAVELRQADIMEMELAGGGPWDLVVLAETASYLGWARPLYDLGWFAHSLREATVPGGRLLLANTIDHGKDTSLMSPWLVVTYRDLLVNAGYAVERGEMSSGEKEAVRFDVLLTLLTRT